MSSGKGKARLILLNKADLASDRANDAWAAYFREKGCFVVKLDSRSKNGMKEVQTVIQDACKEKTERDRKRGILNRPVRAMVVGIPNVGKSTFINSFAGRACAKTGNKPGVTKGAQWIRLNKQVELLDTPGILWPKFDDQQVGLRLAMLGSVNDEILNLEELAAELGAFLLAHFPAALEERYEGYSSGRVMEKEAMLSGNCSGKRMSVPKAAKPDLAKAASFLLDDFRSGRLGRITLEFPDK